MQTPLPSRDSAPPHEKATADIFTLPSAITIETVEAIAEELKHLEFSPPALVLDASQTETITTPGIQLLLALSKTLQQHGIGLVITQAQPTFTQAFETLGLASRLTEWEASKWLKQS